MDWYQNGGKRFIDFVLASIGLVLAFPVILALCVLIMLVDRHSPLFSQTRVGRGGKPFTLFKLRTMPKATPNVPTHEAPIQHISTLGRLLRKTRLDELPQLANVIVGQMSLVGPRPCLPSQRELINARSKRGVVALRPGVTGLSQVNGIDMSNPEVLAISDSKYAASISFHHDLNIIAKTIVSLK
ncbi:MAG: sugar transferase [Pseudomonadota bacterium]